MLKDTYVVFIDMEKCFDKLWLKDGVKDLWKCGTCVSDAVLIKKMNENSNIVIKTPVGESKQINVKNIVRQGTVSGPDICCSSTDQVNKIGKSVITFYGPDIEIGAPIYVDDINVAGNSVTANNLVYNCRLLEDRKKMTVNTDPSKSGYICINRRGGKEEKEETITEKVKKGYLSKVEEYKYLGVWMNKKGTYMINIEKIKKKLPFLILSAKQIGNSFSVGKYALTARMKLLETVIMPGILHGAEAFHEMSRGEVKELNSVQHKILCELIGVPISTPYEPMLMEAGLWLMEYRLMYKRLMLYHNILNSGEERIVKRILTYQDKEEREGTWTTKVKRFMAMVGMTKKVREVMKSEWKKEVKTKINIQNEKEVRLRCEEMQKGRTVKGDEWGRKEYFQLRIEEAREIMKSRLHMMPLPCNFGKGNDGCEVCGHNGKIATEHYFGCGGTSYLRKKWNITEKDSMETMNGSNLVKISKYLRQVTYITGIGVMNEES